MTEQLSIPEELKAERMGLRWGIDSEGKACVEIALADEKGEILAWGRTTLEVMKTFLDSAKPEAKLN